MKPRGLTGREARPVLTRAAFVALVAWVPTVVLAVVQGVALAGTPQESLLLEFRVHVVFLFALPLLVFAETSVLPRLAANARHFWESGLVPRERRAEAVSRPWRCCGSGGWACRSSSARS